MSKVTPELIDAVDPESTLKWDNIKVTKDQIEAIIYAVKTARTIDMNILRWIKPEIIEEICQLALSTFKKK